MFHQNIKTSFGGLGMVLTGLTDIVHGFSTDASTIKWEMDIGLIIGGLGLLFAKDHDVTGGTKIQATSPEVLVNQLIEEQDAGIHVNTPVPPIPNPPAK